MYCIVCLIRVENLVDIQETEVLALAVMHSTRL